MDLGCLLGSPDATEPSCTEELVAPASIRQLLKMFGVHGLCEINEETLNFLQRVSLVLKTYQCAERVANLYTKQIQEYQAAEYLLKHQLAAVNLQPQQLRPSCQDSLSSLVTVTAALQRCKSCTSDITSGWVGCFLEKCQAETFQEDLDHKAKTLEAALADGVKLLERVHSSLVAANASQAGRQQNRSDLVKRTQDFDKKASTYTQSETGFRNSLAKIGYCEKLSHASLLNVYQEYQEGQQALHEARQRRQNYHDLPPSLLGAQTKLKQARENLACAHAQLDQGIASL